MHHFFLVFLDGRQVEEQFWMKNTSNALSIVVQTLCVASVSVSLTQLVCITIYYCEQISYIPRRSGGSSAAGPLLLHSWISYSAYQDTYPLSGLILSKSSWGILPIIFISTLIPVYTLVSILAPNALEIGPASPKVQTLTVPTIFFGQDPLEHGWAYPRIPGICFYQLTSNFERVLGSALRF